jgi:hypothetical protein
MAKGGGSDSVAIVRFGGLTLWEIYQSNLSSEGNSG